MLIVLIIIVRHNGYPFVYVCASLLLKRTKICYASESVSLALPEVITWVRYGRWMVLSDVDHLFLLVIQEGTW